MNNKKNEALLIEDDTATPQGLYVPFVYEFVAVASVAAAAVAVYLGVAVVEYGAVAEVAYNYQVAYENQYIYTSK